MSSRRSVDNAEKKAHWSNAAERNDERKLGRVERSVSHNSIDSRKRTEATGGGTWV